MLRYLVSAVLLLGVACVDVPDPDTPGRFACISDDDCIDEYECSPMGRCIPIGASDCMPQFDTTCDENGNVIDLDSCGNPMGLHDDCSGRGECCDDFPMSRCVPCA